MPPTSQIVKNLVEEMRGGRVNKNWVGQFIKYYSIRLKSVYLRNINNLHASAKYTLIFQLFFSIISVFLLLFRVYTYGLTTNLYRYS